MATCKLHVDAASIAEAEDDQWAVAFARIEWYEHLIGNSRVSHLGLGDCCADSIRPRL
jgi:hypothetical protein